MASLLTSTSDSGSLNPQDAVILPHPGQISNLSNACTSLHMTKMLYRVLIYDDQPLSGKNYGDAVGLFSTEFHSVLARRDQCRMGMGFLTAQKFPQLIFWPDRGLGLYKRPGPTCQADEFNGTYHTKTLADSQYSNTGHIIRTGIFQPITENVRWMARSRCVVLGCY